MIQRGSGQESLTALRSPVLTGAGACGAVLVLEDGIPIRPVGSCNVNELFEVNIEQAAAVEILRGPGSVLYGSSAVHGIINVIPPMPDEIPVFGAALEGGSDAWRRRLGSPHPATPMQAASASSCTRPTTAAGGTRPASRKQKLNAVWARPFGDGALKLRALRLEPRPGDGGIHPSGEDAYRDPRPRPLESGSRGLSRRDVACDSRRSTSGASGDELRALPSQFAHGFPAALPARPADRGERPGQRRLHVHDDGRGFAGGELIAGFDTELARSSLLQYQSGPTTDGPPAANAIRPAGRHYDYDVDSSVVAAYANWRRAARAALVARGGTSPRACALRLRQPHDRRQHGRERRALPRRLPLFTAGGSYGRLHEPRAAARSRVEHERVGDGAISRFARGFPRAGGDRALSAATPAVRRRPRFRGRSMPRSSGSAGARKRSRSTSRSFTWTRAT